MAQAPKSWFPLAIPPGHRPQATAQNTGANWWSMNGVRFPGGILRPIGGWAALPGMQIAKLGGPDPSVRAIFAWRDNSGQRWIAAAGFAQIQVYDDTGHDITPSGYTAGNYLDIYGGYGMGNYGAGIYGEPVLLAQGEGNTAPSDTVTFDNFGEDLIAMGSGDGRLLRWSPSSDGPHTPMQVVANAPVGRLARITAERYGVVIGADGDPRRVSWSDEEDLTTWTPTISNQAGSLQLQSQGMGIQAARVREGLLIWTTEGVHILQFVGPPYAYGLVRVGQGCGPCGPNACVATLGVTAWMGENMWWQWRGMPTPLQSPVQDYVFRNINRDIISQVCGFHNGLFPEITWYYPSEGATAIDSYVTWDYSTNLWWTGKQGRTACAEPGANGFPLTGDANGLVYQHEFGFTDNGNPRFQEIYAETGDVQIGGGDQALHVAAILPDALTDNLANISFQFTGQWAPGDVQEEYGPFYLERSDGVIDALFEARSIRMLVAPMADQDWGLGKVRLWVTPGAGR